MRGQRGQRCCSLRGTRRDAPCRVPGITQPGWALFLDPCKRQGNSKQSPHPAPLPPEQGQAGTPRQGSGAAGSVHRAASSPPQGPAPTTHYHHVPPPPCHSTCLLQLVSCQAKHRCPPPSDTSAVDSPVPLPAAHPTRLYSHCPHYRQAPPGHSCPQDEQTPQCQHPSTRQPRTPTPWETIPTPTPILGHAGARALCCTVGEPARLSHTRGYKVGAWQACTWAGSASPVGKTWVTLVWRPRVGGPSGRRQPGALLFETPGSRSRSGSNRLNCKGGCTGKGPALHPGAAAPACPGPTSSWTGPTGVHGTHCMATTQGTCDSRAALDQLPGDLVADPGDRSCRHGRGCMAPRTAGWRCACTTLGLGAPPPHG